MKFFAATLVLNLASAAALLQSPEVSAVLVEQPTDSFGNSKLEPPCSKVECGEYECPAPFELKTGPTCCGYCWAPDHVIAVDRHSAVAYNSSGFAVELCESAPSSCSGPGANAVRCFKPSCREGEEPHCAPGACCEKCAPAR